MPEAEILTDSRQMLLRALAAKDAEIERLRDENEGLRGALRELVSFVGKWAKSSGAL